MSAPMMSDLGIRREQLARQVDVARRVDVAHGDPDELEAGSGAVGELVAVLAQQRGDLRADGSGAQQRDAQAAVVGHVDPFRQGSRGRGPASRASRSSIVSPRTMTRASPPRTRHDRRAGDVVVVAREREAVRAGRGHGEQVARARRRRAGTRRRRRCRPTRSACRRRARAPASASLAREAMRAENCAPYRAGRGLSLMPPSTLTYRRVRALAEPRRAWSCRPRRG